MTTPRPKIGFLACDITLPGSPERRGDAFEHDLQVAALRPALAAEGLDMVELDWAAPLDQFDGIDLAVIGTTWNYWDREEEFLTRLDALEARGITLCNAAATVRWNIRKTYLRALEAAGAATIPTLWLEQPGRDDIARAYDDFGTDRLVIKRQVGAGAEGQQILSRDSALPLDWAYGWPAMVQPFLASIQSEGEYSFLMIDGEFSHAVLKRAKPGDYRIQSVYGGSEETYQPAPQDIATARDVIAMLPFATPLYARVDLVRLDNGDLAVIEVEMIEPYLYPEQGPELGPRMARSIVARLQRHRQAAQ